jgi:hypothetical protein
MGTHPVRLTLTLIVALGGVSEPGRNASSEIRSSPAITAGSFDLLSVNGHLDSRERIVKPTLLRSVSIFISTVKLVT